MMTYKFMENELMTVLAVDASSALRFLFSSQPTSEEW